MIEIETQFQYRRAYTGRSRVSSAARAGTKLAFIRPVVPVDSGFIGSTVVPFYRDEIKTPGEPSRSVVSEEHAPGWLNATEPSGRAPRGPEPSVWAVESAGREMPVLTNRMKRALPLVAAAALVLSGCDGFTIEKTLGRRAGPNALGLRVGKQDPGATTDLGNGVRTARAAASPGTAALRPPGEREALGPRLDADTARPAGTCRALLAPEEAGAGNLPTGWTVRAVAGGKVPRVRAVRAAEGDTVLRIRSDDGAAFFYRTLDPPLEGAGSLRWRWRTSSPVQGARP